MELAQQIWYACRTIHNESHNTIWRTKFISADRAHGTTPYGDMVITYVTVPNLHRFYVRWDGKSISATRLGKTNAFELRGSDLALVELKLRGFLDDFG